MKFHNKTDAALTAATMMWTLPLGTAILCNGVICLSIRRYRKSYKL